jgi:chromosome segregation ATPase
VTDLSRIAVERNNSLESKTKEIENLKITLQDRESDLQRANNVAQSTSETLQRSVTSLESQLRTAAEEVKRQTRLIELLQREKKEMKERVRGVRARRIPHIFLNRNKTT